MSAGEVLKESSRLMKGYKWQLIRLYFSYIGWFLLGMVTFGIAIIYISPYITGAVARFYTELRGPKEGAVDDTKLESIFR